MNNELQRWQERNFCQMTQENKHLVSNRSTLHKAFPMRLTEMI